MFRWVEFFFSKNLLFNDIFDNLMFSTVFFENIKVIDNFHSQSQCLKENKIFFQVDFSLLLKTSTFFQELNNKAR